MKKKLVLESVIIISQTEKTARKIDFSPLLNVLVSRKSDGATLNRTGKSFVLKSIFYGFGADLTTYTTNWSAMNISTILRYTFNGKPYVQFRYADSVVIKDVENNTIKNFNSRKELKEYYPELFDFNIKLPTTNSKKVSHLYPGGVFLPFYIDQDHGWQGEWRSFSDVNFYKDWKKEILLFHTGVKPHRYYELLEKQTEYDNINRGNKNKQKVLTSIYDEQLRRNNAVLDVNLRVEDFSQEIGQLTLALNRQLIVKNSIKEDLLNLYNEKYELEEQYRNATVILKDIEKDAQYLNDYISDEIIKCPTCGTNHTNDVSNRYAMYQEIEKCRNMIKEYLEYEPELNRLIEEKENEIDVSGQVKPAKNGHKVYHFFSNRTAVKSVT